MPIQVEGQSVLEYALPAQSPPILAVSHQSVTKVE